MSKMEDAADQELDSSGGVKRLCSELIENDDVIAEVLLRLPVKSLIRFRCVCKSWCALISDQYFVEKHLSRIVTGLNENRFNLLLPSKPLHSIDYNALLKYFKKGDLKFEYPVVVFRNLSELISGDVSIRALDWPVMTPKYRIQIYGSCNGLVCIEFDYVNIILWNPYTGDSKLLPKPNLCIDETADMYGFGYESTSEDYKVIRGCWNDNGLNGTTIEIFTLKTGSWRQYCTGFVLAGQGCLLNEALHWVQSEWEDWEYIVGSTIVSFDLAEEKFLEMVQCPNPLADSDECYYSVGIGAIGNCLSVCLEPSDSDLSIWMMKEYGVKESWTEVVNITREALPKDYELKSRPLGISESGEVLMNLERNVLALYSPNEKKFKTVIVTHQHVIFDTAIYVESLVSPETGCDIKLTWEQCLMGMDTRMNTNSFKLLLPICPLHSLDYESLFKYLKEADVHLASTSSFFDYPVLIRRLDELIYGHVASRELDHPVMIPKFSVQIYGSCNGLICLEVDYHNIILWNPCTGDSKLLPKATPFYDDQCARFYGFGYDSTNKDYKVIRGYYNYNPATSVDEGIFEVFTLKTGSWRQDLNFICVVGQGCLVNESLHWVEYEYEDMGYINDSKIVSFNLDEEKFQEVVPSPNPPPGSECYNSVEIGAIGDCLCVCFETIDSDLRIWVMKKYGVKESWTEVIKIPQEVVPIDFQFDLKPFCILENGEVLLNLHRNILALYNPKANTFRTVVETHEDQRLNMAIYVETLVSPVTGSGASM